VTRVGARPDPAVPFAARSCPALVHERFVAQAERTPEALALQSVHGRCSYRELEQVSRALACSLARRGIGPGRTVAVYAERGPALVFCLLGVLRSGATFVILDAAYPVQRLVACSRQVQPTLLWVAGELQVPADLSQLFEVERVPSTVSAVCKAFVVEGAAPAPVIAREQIAYYGFTSGSTGAPKGIATRHAPLPHFVDWHVEHGALDAHDRFSMLSGLGHDPLLRDVFTPLSIGASLCIPRQATLFDADALFSWLEEQRITVAHLTPAFGEILLAGATRTLPCLRRMYWGGDVLTRRLVRAIAAIAPNAQQTNFYGATETPQAMAYFDLAELGDSLVDDAPVPLGRGIADAQLLVIDQDQRLCWPGELGEIWVRSPYLAQGYLDSAETTARFVANPFGASAEDRCYRTGDLGRYREDGDVVFAGRRDHQLKLRGFRVEPAEIVGALEREPGVERALVKLDADERLVAYVQHGASRPPSQLRERLLVQLPSYMVPQSFVMMAAFPLLPNGKVDLQALPASAPKREVGRAPRTEAERRLAVLWAELLGLDEVSIDASFLELGGDSLSAIRALARMRALGLSENVARGIFQGRTIAQLAGSEPVPEETEGLAGGARTLLLLNVLRGFMVLTLVLDHWRAGIAKRLPVLPHGLTALAEPLFDLPTPGFAFVFGVGLAYSQYENYLRSPKSATYMLRRGALILGAGTLLMGLSRNLGVVARGLPLDYDLFSTNFFLPTLYYALAMASAPWWFACMARREGKPGGSLAAAALLTVACRIAYELCRLVLLPHEQVGLLQLLRLMLTARFSYFNLSTGALLGVCAGLVLHRVRLRRSLVAPLLAAGTASLAVGLFTSQLGTGSALETLRSADLPMPKWFAYVGVSLLLGALFDVVLVAFWRAALVRSALQWLGVVGQCAMPIFILQGITLDVSAFARDAGLPDKASATLAAVLFTLIVGTLMRLIHGLYYGSLEDSDAVSLAEDRKVHTGM
jgi:amino acid adenylation domain-containing protein